MPLDASAQSLATGSPTQMGRQGCSENNLSVPMKNAFEGVKPGPGHMELCYVHTSLCWKGRGQHTAYPSATTEAPQSLNTIKEGQQENEGTNWDSKHA